MIDGTHTHISSFNNVAAPAELKNANPIGDDTIGRHGRKKRPALNGAKNATPNVPSTIASSTECDAVAAKKNANNASRLIATVIGFLKNNSTTNQLSKTANKNECVRPR